MKAVALMSWYWNRLRCMSFGEMLYRVRSKLKKITEQAGIGIVRDVPEPDCSHDGAMWVAVDVEVDANDYLRAADEVVDGRLKIFSLSDAEIGKEPDWNRDPRTGIHAPLKFGKTLNYRDESIVGDIKYLWEPNRHLQLVWLCQSYRLGGGEEYLVAFRMQLESWFRQCPYLLGPNWSSSLELGIRLINWAICWQLIWGNGSKLFEGEAGKRFRRDWYDSIFRHCHYIAGHWSRYSSANNHLIGEAAGLYVASVTWPYWPETDAWKEASCKILHRESRLQTHPDGVNREQAVSYQQFVLDFLLIAGLAARSSGEGFSEDYWQNIERMLEFIASIMDCSGNVPMIGDADDGYVVSLSQERNFCPFRSLLATGSVLFSRPEFMEKAGHLDDKTRWLLGDCLKEKPEHAATTGALPASTVFPDGGYYIIGSDFETENEIRMLVDAGPLGYLSIAAHGHADALSVVLNVGGVEILVDPGTYAYHTQKEWRDYFRGTPAHNTISVDGLDQSQSGGNFMWLRHARVDVEKWRQGACSTELCARHDGYTRLPDPVVHRRHIFYDALKRKFMIQDRIECTANHQVSRWWHFPEECSVEEGVDGVRVENRGQSVRFLFNGEQTGERCIYSGSEQPNAGWVSRSFDVKRPATTLVEQFTVSGAITVTATIEVL